MLAVAAGFSGVLYHAPAGVSGLIMGGLTLTLLALCFVWRPLKLWLASVDLGVLVALHTTRFVGLAFLLLYVRGDLARDFAMTGWGDLAIAGWALVVTTRCLPVRGPRCLRSIGIWNGVGLLEKITAISIGLAACHRDPMGMVPLRTMPLILLPIFLGPIILVSHLVIFRRVFQGIREPNGPSFPRVHVSSSAETR